MKKRNIVRFTAFIMVMLMCTSSAVTLFAEGVDSTEESVIEATESVTTEATESSSEESASEAITEDETETQTVSGNETTPTKPTRSELGQKILEFKNSNDYKNKQVFTLLDNIILKYADSTKVKVGIYNKETDTIVYKAVPTNASKEYDSWDLSIWYKESINDVSFFGDNSDALNQNIITSTLYPDAWKRKDNYWICLFKEDCTDDSVLDGLLFSASLDETIKSYTRDLAGGSDFEVKENNSTVSVSQEPIVDSTDAVNNVDLTFTFDIIDMYDYANDVNWESYFELNHIKDKTNYLQGIFVYDSDDNLVASYSEKNSVKTGTATLRLSTGVNGTYKYKVVTTLPAFMPNTTTIYGTIDVTAFKKGTDITKPDSEEEVKQATVSFSGLPNEAYTGDSVVLKMNTDKKCILSFNGSPIANNELATSGDVTVTENGIYSYTAVTEKGVVTEGNLEVTFFKEREDIAVSDPLQSDLVSAKTDTTLSQTGLYQTWLIILAVILCSFGILLIANQKYHFLDKFVRRFKHESN